MNANEKDLPSANDPRCATCGDIVTWGTHPICDRDDDGELLTQEGNA